MGKGHPWAWGSKRAWEHRKAWLGERERDRDRDRDWRDCVSCGSAPRQQSNTVNMLSILNLGDMTPRGRWVKILRGLHKVINSWQVIWSYTKIIKSQFSEVLKDFLTHSKVSKHCYFLENCASSLVTSCCTSPDQKFLSNHRTPL